MAQGVHTFFNRMSQGNLDFNFDVLDSWVSLGDSARKYNLGAWNGGEPGAYYIAALTAADPYVDFSLFDIVYFMSPTNVTSDYIAYGPAFPMKVMTADGYVKNGTISGADAYQPFPGALWKWAAHETGHLFGIYDLYTIEPQAGTYGSWDLMSLNWSTKAVELNSWNRFTQGWLTSDQYLCVNSADITKEGLSSSIISLTADDPGLKSVMVKLSETKMLVVESRRTGGLDAIPANEEGILIYTVDMTIDSIRGGYQTQRRPGSTAADFTDALLKTGDRITVEGLTITVTSSDKKSTIQISRP
jgi:M6 family metalloprotease-like protein